MYDSRNQIHDLKSNTFFIPLQKQESIYNHSDIFFSLVDKKQTDNNGQSASEYFVNVHRMSFIMGFWL